MVTVVEQELKGRVEKYRRLTETALGKISIVAETGRDKAVAEDFLQMCKSYLSDGKHFEEQGKLSLALAAYSYAHAWLDAGVRAKLFDAKGNSKLFTLP